MESMEIVKAEVSPILAAADSIAIRDETTWSHAGEFLKNVIKAQQRRVKDFFAASKEAAAAAHKAVCANEKSLLDPLDRAERTVKTKMISFQDEQQRIRREAERKAALEAARLQEEAAKLARQAAQAAARGQEEKAQEKQDAAQEKAIQAAEAALASTAAPQLQKFQGFHLRKIWKYKVVDFKAIPLEYMLPNDSALLSLAKSTKGSIKIPGIEFFEAQA
jgi:hypothetical protein